MPDMLTILYTQNLNGQIDLLPRLATFIWQLRKDSTEPLLLLDAGNSCSAEDPLCRMTGGRAALIVLDAMGYDAANVSGFLADNGREKLKDNYLEMALTDADHPYVVDGIAFAAISPDAIPHRLHIALDTAPKTHLLPEPVFGFIYTLVLQTLSAQQVGQVTVEISPTGTTLHATHIHDLPANTRPDPTISGTIDFVRNEAQYFRKGQSPKSS